MSDETVAGYLSTGYVCSCGMWVAAGATHVCQQPTITTYFPKTKNWQYCPHCGKALE